MKYIVCILIGLIFCCKNDIENENQEDTPLLVSSEIIADSFLTLDNLRDFLPDELLKEKSMVFQDANGKEITMTTKFSEYTSERIVNEQQYTSETIGIELREEETNFQIILLGYAIYDDINLKVLESLTILLMPSYSDANTSGRIVLDNEGYVLSYYSKGDADSVTLIDTTYENTYSFMGDNPDRFSELFYKADIGILGFRTFTNNLYVFKEFVD